MRGTKTIKKKQTIPEGYKQTAVGIIPKEWEVYEIGKLVSLASGGTPSRQIGEYWNGNIPWITTGLIKNGIIDTAEEYITELGLKNSSAKIFPAGTILMAMYGQGKTRGSVAKLSFEAATNQACAALMPRESTSRDFLFYYLKFNYENIRNLSNTGNQENLSLQLIRTIKVKHPPLPEQQKIAAILSTWDEAIEK